VAAERLAGARAPDSFESEPQQFFARVAAGYAERALAQPERFARIDSHRPKQAVWQAVRQAVAAQGWLPASKVEG
jgi:dTMP kinase